MHERGRTNSRAAGECFAFDSALVGAKDEGTRSENLGEIGIRAFRSESIVPAEGGAKSLNVDDFDIGDKDNSVRHAGIDKVDMVFSAGNCEQIGVAMILWASHVESDEFPLECCGNKTGLRFKFHRSRFFRHQPGGKSRKTASPIPTHLRLPAIAVVVAHAKIRLAIRRLHGQQSIRTDPSVPVAETRYGCAIKCETPCPIVEDNEVVSRAVHFCESNIHPGDRVDLRRGISQSESREDL